MKLCTAWIIRHSSKTIFAKHVERYKVSKFCPGKGVIYPFPIKILYDNYACWFSTRLTVTITHKQMLWFPVNFTISMRILHHKINTHWIDMLFRRMVTFLIFAPYKYSYLLTYLLTYLHNYRPTHNRLRPPYSLRYSFGYVCASLCHHAVWEWIVGTWTRTIVYMYRLCTNSFNDGWSK